MISSLLILIYHVVLLVEFGLQREIEARTITNKMRYGQSGTDSGKSLVSTDVTFELAEATRLFAANHQTSLSENSYKINRDSSRFREGRLLDDEDKGLLEKFYRETKQNDPFLGDSLSTESLWDELEHNQSLNLVSALVDTHQVDKIHNSALRASKLSGNWTVGPELSLKGVNGIELNLYNKVPIANNIVHQANYSPTLRLLTSYDPIQELSALTNGPSIAGTYLRSGAGAGHQGDRIVGATLYGHDENLRPSVSSKSALDAVKLHDEFLKEPPRDGKVRVRMYYHRAIHDDARLFGSGPWKYWGHGWGVEFGFNPRSEASKNDFYQKGYTIERAFGRDFCKNKNNCRRPDPDFFKDPHNVGKYSEQQLRKPTRLEAKRPSNEYQLFAAS